MSERERLIELIHKALLDMRGKYVGMPVKRCKHIADYLLEHGVIVLPCKVGDTVWCVIEDTLAEGGWFISEEHVTDVSIRGIWLSQFAPPEDDHGNLIPWEQVGINTFLTREEAEAALAESNGKR